MFLNSLSINNYKSFSSAKFNFDKKINCFIGKNGVGKSNIMDANYSFLEEVRNDQSSDYLYRDILEGYHEFGTKGNIDAVGVSLSAKILDRINFGLSVINQHSESINSIPLPIIVLSQ